jgi:hypothetical protein
MSLVSSARLDPFAEHMSVMKSLYFEYQRRDEADNIALVEALIAETSNMAKSKESSVHAAIKQLSSACVDLEVLATHPEPEGAHSKRMAAMEAEVKASSHVTAALKAELR